MKLVTYKGPAGLNLGIKTDEGVLDVASAKAALGPTELPATPKAVLAAGNAALVGLQALVARAEGKRELFRPEEALNFGPAVPRPGKIICVGLNYRRHAIESNMKIPESPVLFSKFSNSIAAPNEVVTLAPNAVEYDYEVELGFVIGKEARYVSQADALSYVLGYCIANDLSARDLQFRTNQWLLGKALDQFLPVGPYLVTADEVGDPQTLGLRCWLNGELRQNSNTADMIFPVAELVSYMSQYMTLEPGDLICTGTPEGVIMGMAERNWLKPGDEVTVEVDRLGRMSNKMAK